MNGYMKAGECLTAACPSCLAPTCWVDNRRKVACSECDEPPVPADPPTPEGCLHVTDGDEIEVWGMFFACENCLCDRAVTKGGIADVCAECGERWEVCELPNGQPVSAPEGILHVTMGTEDELTSNFMYPCLRCLSRRGYNSCEAYPVCCADCGSNVRRRWGGRMIVGERRDIQDDRKRPSGCLHVTTGRNATPPR